MIILAAGKRLRSQKHPQQQVFLFHMYEASQMAMQFLLVTEMIFFFFAVLPAVSTGCITFDSYANDGED